MAPLRLNHQMLIHSRKGKLTIQASLLQAHSTRQKEMGQERRPVGDQPDLKRDNGYSSGTQQLVNSTQQLSPGSDSATAEDVSSGLYSGGGAGGGQECHRASNMHRTSPQQENYLIQCQCRGHETSAE